MLNIRYMAHKIIALFLIAMIASVLADRADAQDQSSDMSGWWTGQSWWQRYKACFDPQSRPLPDKLRDLVIAGESRRATIGSASTTPDWEQLALLTALAGAYRNLREWTQAESRDRELIAFIAANRQRSGSALAQQFDWYNQEAARSLAGTYAMQGRWRAAFRCYLWLVWLDFLQTYAFVGSVPFLLLGLWRLKSWTTAVARVPRRTWFYLALCAAGPYLFMLFNACTSLLVSATLYRNPLAFLALSSYYPRVGTIVETIWITLLTGLSLAVRRRWIRQTTAKADETSDDWSPPKAIALSKLRKMILFAILIVFGWAIQHISYEPWYLNVALHLRDNLIWWQHSGRADTRWIYDTAMKTTVGSWVQELFFRGILYRYTRRIFGSGFAMVFSSCVFSAWHGEPQAFYELFWTGVICAYLYEVSHSLIPSTVTHCLHNFLVTIGTHA